MPDEWVGLVFENPKAQDMLRQVMNASGLQGAAADLPMETKKAVVAMLIERGVIRFGEPNDGETDHV